MFTDLNIVDGWGSLVGDRRCYIMTNGNIVERIMDDPSRPDVEESEVLEEVAQVLSHDLSNLLVTAQSSLE